MARFAVFMRCLSVAVLKRGVKTLAEAVPFGVVLYDVAADTLAQYFKNHDEAELRVELGAIAATSSPEMARAVKELVRAVGPSLPEDARLALEAYLMQLPATARRYLRRRSDPSGRTIPSKLSLRRAEELMAFLPDRVPRFKPGDRPLPGVDRQLVELLGIGGFGEVWLACNPYQQSDPRVVLKFCLDAEAAKALRNEAALLDRIKQRGHQTGIVPLRQTYLSAEPPCLEYEYVQGGDVAGLIQEWHREAGGPSPEQAARLVLHLTEIVAFAHAAQPHPVVHRDLKPANILVRRTSTGRTECFITDFGIGGIASRQALKQGGLGKVSNGRKSEQRDLATALRGAHTALYASPEQITGADPDPRDDVYALGVIWYQLLSGDLTTGAPSGFEWAEKLTKRGMPYELVRLLGACVEPEAGARPVDAGDLARQLKGLLAGKPASTPQGGSVQNTATPPMPGSPLPKAGSLRAAAVGIVAVVLLVAAGLTCWQYRSGSKTAAGNEAPSSSGVTAEIPLRPDEVCEIEYTATMPTTWHEETRQRTVMATRNVLETVREPDGKTKTVNVERAIPVTQTYTVTVPEMRSLTVLSEKWPKLEKLSVEDGRPLFRMVTYWQGQQLSVLCHGAPSIRVVKKGDPGRLEAPKRMPAPRPDT